MSNYPVPDEERLKRLIRDAYEFLPGPDMARLQALEGHLNRKMPVSRKPRRSTRTGYWWLVLLLAGGVATAAWWSGRFFEVSDSTEREQVDEPGPVHEAPPPEPESEQDDATGESGQKTDSPVIYQRGSF